MPASSDPPSDAAELALAGQENEAGGEITLIVVLPAGVALHARPAANLVRAASKLQTPVTISANGKHASSRSILEVLGLGATDGAEVTLSATGPGAAEAVNALAAVVAGLGA